MHRTLAVMLLCLTAACGAKTTPTEPLPSPIVADRDAGVGQTTHHTGGSAGVVTCTRNADCAAGEMCHGAEGCDAPWTCVPARPCTKDLVFYCGCDGKDLQGSGSCPPGPYSHKGKCP